jgi:hypothetical protein
MRSAGGVFSVSGTVWKTTIFPAMSVFASDAAAPGTPRSTNTMSAVTPFGNVVPEFAP